MKFLGAGVIMFNKKNCKGGYKVKKAAWILAVTALVTIPAARAQDGTQPTQSAEPTGQSPNSDSQNIQEYVELLRSNVRQQKAEILGAVLQLSATDAAKFWPIYEQYDAQLNKLNDLRLANIQEYARNYNQMTGEKADQLIRQALAYRRQRSELLANYYDRVKQGVGPIIAARFVQVEDQLLLIMDLQIDSSLPIVGEGS